MEKVKMAKEAKDNAEISSEEQISEEFQDTEIPQPQTLTLQELDQIAQIIDLASQRGAFRGGELEAVGSLYNKLASFLAGVKAQQDAAIQEAAESQAQDEDAPEESGEE